MKLMYATINHLLWITGMLINHSHMVSSNKAVPATYTSEAIPTTYTSEAVPTTNTSEAVPTTYTSEAVPTTNTNEAVPITNITQHVKQQIMVDIDVDLTVIDSIHKKISNERKLFQTVQCKYCKQEKASGGTIIINLIIEAGEVSPIIEGVTIGLEVIKMIYSFNSNKKIQGKLDNIIDKLDDISREINSLEDELRASIEFNTWLVHFNEYEQNIINGEVCLNDTFIGLKSETNEKKKLKLANDFLRCYNLNNIEGSAQGIYSLTGKPSSPTSKNLFELLVNEKGCDIIELSRLMMIIRDLMARAAKQSLVYYFFKDGNENRVGKSLTKYQSFLYDIRDYYNNQVWYCFRNFEENARIAAMQAIDENKENIGSLSSIIQEKLLSLIPWYSWTVAQFEKKEGPNVTVSYLHFFHTYSVTFKAEGETKFLITDYSSANINVIVVWQDSEDVFRSCGDTGISSTKVYFKPSDSFIKSDNMIDERMCNEFLKDIVKQKYDDPSGKISSHLTKSVSFVAASIGSHNDDCKKNPCLNEGICNPIKNTNSRFCMCKPFYEGDNCEDDIGNSLADNATAILAKLREHFGITTGIPDVIDIYYQINDLSTDIKNMQQSLQYYSEYGNLVTLYGKSIKDAEYISNFYHDFQNGTLEVDSFGKILDKFNFDYILLDFSQMIAGDAILVEDDFLTSKKKTLSQTLGGCTKEYSNSVKLLMRNLVTLDQLVVESMIWHAHWKISNTIGIQRKKSILNDVHQTYESTIERQKIYFDNWDAKSCPRLTIKDAQINGNDSIHCDNGLSFEGLSISVQCMDYTLKTLSDQTVTCSMDANTGSLNWVGIPHCEFATSWSEWSAWSECSVTCDGGIQIRHRRRTDGQKQNDTRVCNTDVSCCENAGNHLCSNDVCIRPGQLCDGTDDCGNNEDEKDCRYLRVGDIVAIKSPCGKWMSCKNGRKGKHCQCRECPGDYMNQDDWKGCTEEVFNYIDAENRVEGQAIRHGDRVALRYSTHSPGYWLTCQDENGCYTHTCPGISFEDTDYSQCPGEVYWILSEHRVGSCNFQDSPGCIGEPIKPLDTIHLLHDLSHTNGRWVSGDNTKPRLRTCPVRSDPAGCKCEQWEIHIKKYAH